MIRAQALAHLTAPGQAYELVELEIRGSRQRVFKNAPACLRDLYAGNLGDETFYVYEDERLSYAEAWRRAAKIAVILRDRYGVAKGDRVAISMRNYPEWVQAFMAITSLGAIAVAMNALWQPAEMAYGLNNCGAKVLLADQERLNRFAQIAEEVEAQLIAVRPTKAAGDWTDLAGLVDNLGDVEMPLADIAPDDNALIIYTSGSTGHPKGAVSTHRNVVSALLSWELDLQAGALMSGLEPAPPAWPPATLLGVPLFHVMGSHVIFLASYRSRRKIVSCIDGTRLWRPN